MHDLSLRMRIAIVCIFAGILAAGPALAEKPSWAGGEKGGHQNPSGKQEKHDAKGDQGRRDRGRHQFNDQHRASIQDYFADQYRHGRCPPGLAKKHNGCMPRGQARRWAIGRQLPQDVIFYDLPATVLVQLGAPPARHRFVRVAQDILLLATGTGMVVDAIDNLNWEFGR